MSSLNKVKKSIPNEAAKKRDEVAKKPNVVKKSVSNEVAKEQNVVEESVPNEVAKEQNVVEESIPNEVAKEQNVVEESIPNEVAKEQNVVEGSIPNEAAKEQNVVEESISNEVAQKENVVEESQLVSLMTVENNNTNSKNVNNKKTEKSSDDTSIEKHVDAELASNKENVRVTNSKTQRSVYFKEEVDDIRPQPSKNLDESRHRSKYNRPVDFLDALVNSYKIETTIPSTSGSENKKYVPKTVRTRLNPNWREHRTRRLMNKLEELSLWDREEELKFKQAEWLREQKWEQIQDRQRNHDLCLTLMKARHESEMESAVTLDNRQNDDFNTTNTILNTLQLSSLNNAIDYDIPMAPQSLKRHVKQKLQQDETNQLQPRTPIGRYRQFESNMKHKRDRINEKLKPDTEIIRAYGPQAYIPPVPMLFSETYSRLLASPSSYESPSLPTSFSSYRSKYLHGNERFTSPDYETKLRSYSKRDVRVPLKDLDTVYSSYHDQDDDDDIDDYYSSSYRTGLQKHRSHYSPTKCTTASALYDCSMTTPRNYDDNYYPQKSYHHSTLAGDSLLKTKNSHSGIQERSLNDDLNAITHFSLETTKKILQNVGIGKDDILNGGGQLKSKNSATNNGYGNNRKHVTFSEERSVVSDYDHDDYTLGKRDGGDSRRNYYSSSSSKYPEIISLTSMK
ncbi:unnamed protein product [Didymodactylos carnosus]|uniref:Uncharacterized protein n=1 Tax=Didymodactylos carnosus TaxID=1234261 RepID=A0A814BEF3_9BILA|nr:unnamed protein product [Didymodactylos carnosus]CAF3705248.1 unnamed protein product [Didymodactylos carnosus]